MSTPKTPQGEGVSPITGIKRVRVESSNIAEIGHDEFSGVIEIKFHNGSVWQYPGGFDRHTFEAFRDADSIGKFFRTEIYKRVNPQKHINVTQDEDADSAKLRE